MKKLMTIFGAILFASVILTSCGPSACDCLDEFSHKNSRNSDGTMNLGDVDLLILCYEKFGKDVPDSYRGTERYKTKMIEVLNEKCN